MAQTGLRNLPRVAGDFIHVARCLAGWKTNHPHGKDPRRAQQFVRSNSVFWDVSTVEAKIGFLKVQIDTPPVLYPNGRIEFHTPDHGGVPVKGRTVFPLYPKL